MTSRLVEWLFFFCVFRTPLMFLLWRRPAPDDSVLCRPAAVTNRSRLTAELVLRAESQ